MTPLEFAHTNIGHDFYSCKARLDQLSSWSKACKFLSIAAGPGILLILIQINNPAAIAVGTALVGVGVVPIWAWEIFSLVYHWDRQLETCRIVTREGKKLYERLSSTKLAANSSGSNQAAAIGQAQDLHDMIVNDHITVSNEINIFAQQKVMSECGYSCSNCKQEWKQKTVLPTNVIRKLRKAISKGRCCNACGQSIN